MKMISLVNAALTKLVRIHWKTELEYRRLYKMNLRVMNIFKYFYVFGFKLEKFRFTTTALGGNISYHKIVLNAMYYSLTYK